MINAQKKNAARGSSTRRNRPLKQQLKLLTCVVWMSSVKSTGGFKHHRRNHEGEVIQSAVTNRGAQSSFSAVRENCRNLLLLSTGTPIPPPICVRAQGRDGQMRGKRKRSVLAEKKALDVLDCRGTIGDKKK